MKYLLLYILSLVVIGVTMTAGGLGVATWQYWVVLASAVVIFFTSYKLGWKSCHEKILVLIDELIKMKEQTENERR